MGSEFVPRCSAAMKRAEQLKRWEESDTNRSAPALPKHAAGLRIRFSTDCVFLAACQAADKEEVLRLVQQGANVNMPTADGLTALHQACIDAKLDMVEFLISLGADVNHSDNEGWTPLHATASCGFVSIARYLLNHGADLCSINNEGELAVDIAESGAMKNFLEEEIQKQGIDCAKARKEEERLMLQHAKMWSTKKSEEAEIHDSKTGATPLHVAAAKGYLKVMSILLGNCGVEVDPVDFDGWTPLHASAHWGQPDAATMLVQNGANMEIKNFVGQTCFDVASSDMTSHLLSLKEKQMNNAVYNDRLNRLNRGPLNRIENKIDTKPQTDIIEWDYYGSSSSDNSSDELDSDLSDTDPDSSSDYKSVFSELIDKKNSLNNSLSSTPTIEIKTPKSLASPVTTPTKPKIDDDEPSWRINARNKISDNNDTNIAEKEKAPSETSDIILRRTNSCESDKLFYQRYKALTARIKASSCPSLPPVHVTEASDSHSNTTAATVTRSSSLKDTPYSSTFRLSTPEKQVKKEPSPSPSPNSVNVRSSMDNANDTNTTNNSVSTNPVSKLSPGNIFKNFFKSFVPPVRDEESETQRKAHAKRVRETRRSTQGVTLDELKSAEQLVKKKTKFDDPNSTESVEDDQNKVTPLNITNNADSKPWNSSTEQIVEKPPPTEDVSKATNNNTPIITEVKLKEANGEVNLNSIAVTLALHRPPSADNSISTTATIATTCGLPPERRPSWRLRVDPHAKFALEEVNSSTESPSRDEEASSTVLIPLRRSSQSSAKKDEDKEENRGATQAAQNVIQRRKRPKRRSTGLVNMDMDDLSVDRQNSEDTESGTESAEQSGLEKTDSEENGEIDYKTLWEESQVEIKRLKEVLESREKELTDTKSILEKNKTALTQSTISEAEKREKRERRALERKLSEMEEELKQLQKLKAENERLKAENRALTRVVSKLTNTNNK